MTVLAAPARSQTRASRPTIDRPLVLIGLLAILLRMIASLTLQHPLESDALSYFTMARTLAEQGLLIDNYGLRAFYSAGYPLLLTPFFWLLGSHEASALAVNMALGLLTLGLLYRLALRLWGERLTARMAALAYALWLPGIWNATMLAKENLSTPLLLALLLCALRIAGAERPIRSALAGGAIWGASLVTGGSALLLCAGPGVAMLLLWRRQGAREAMRAGLSFSLGALLLLGPWLYATDRMLGVPTLSTNASFNLYIGNNPAATGHFVSIADTPEGEGWSARRHRLGELGTARRLQAEALDWIAGHPVEAAQLAVRKLVYFWQPNVPDAADFGASRAVAAMQAVNVAQFGAILLAGLWALALRCPDGGARWIISATIGGFWIIHALAYIITRYRDPIMPVMILLAACPAALLWTRLSGGRAVRHAA